MERGFADYYGETSVHPLGLVVITLLGVWILVSNRRYAVVPVLIAMCTIPMAQRIVIAGADFTLLRILLLLCMFRIIFRAEFRNFTWGRLDTVVVLWSCCGTLVMTVQYASVAAFVNRLGWSYDMLIAYFMVRFLIRDFADVKVLSKSIAFISIPVALAFVYEWLTAHNLFSIFGGVPETTHVREGRLRCQGAFAHPIMAGTFWAAMLPLIWWNADDDLASRRISRMATVCVVIIVGACASSTPVLSVAVAFGAVSLFPWRKYRKIGWVGAIAGLILLHLIMRAPVWHLMARVDIVGGSTGYHRYVILDTFIQNFSKWYFLGESDPLSWGVNAMKDITNQYVREGLRGGLLTLLVFIWVLVVAFGNVGRMLKKSPGVERIDQSRQIWLLGSMMSVHAFTFFGVSYFGQVTTLFHIQIALVGCMVVSLSHQRGLSEKSNK